MHLYTTAVAPWPSSSRIAYRCGSASGPKKPWTCRGIEEVELVLGGEAVDEVAAEVPSCGVEGVTGAPDAPPSLALLTRLTSRGLSPKVSEKSSKLSRISDTCTAPMLLHQALVLAVYWVSFSRSSQATISEERSSSSTWLAAAGAGAEPPPPGLRRATSLAQTPRAAASSSSSQAPREARKGIQAKASASTLTPSTPPRSLLSRLARCDTIELSSPAVAEGSSATSARRTCSSSALAAGMADGRAKVRARGR
mmetsp:Transcript_50879/g.146138  ORF Transcript_50879/g.146138 Transcript_50879/m.146138 type:complete len:253 (+) Transcript_50879:1602-2360(+)